jgi:hypothetical protein
MPILSCSISRPAASSCILHVHLSSSHFSSPSGKIESTPHGHFAKHLNKADKGYNPDKTDFHDTLSAINMDHYNVARGSEAVDKEFPRGRRTIQTLKVGGTAFSFFSSSKYKESAALRIFLAGFNHSLQIY